MADLSKTIEVVFQGKSDLDRVTRDMSRDFNALSKSVGDVTAPLAGMADAVLKAEAALAILVAGGMAYAIKSAGEFQEQFGEIETLLDATGAPMEAFKKNILDYSTTSVKSLDDIQKSIYAAISAGLDYADSVEFVARAEKLSVAGRADLESSTKVLVSVLNAYGASAEEAAHYSDILFQTVKLGQTTLPELAGSLASVTSLAAESGVPFDTLSAAIAALTAKGMPTEQALTAIRGVLSNLLKPTSQAATEAARLGIEFDAAALKTKGLEGVLFDVLDATDGNVESIAKLFGNVRGLTGVLALGGSDAELFREKLLGMANATGAVNEAYEKMAGRMEAINQRLMNNFKATVIEVGERLLPQYYDIVNAAGGVFAGIRESIGSGAFDPIFEIVDTMGKRLADMMRDIAKNIPEAMAGLDFTGLTRSLDGLGGAIRTAFVAVFGEIDITTVDGLQKALQRMVDGISALQNITKGVIDGMRPVFAAIGLAIDQFSSLDEKSARFIGTALGVGKTLNILAENSHLLTAALYVLSAKAFVDVAHGAARLGTSVAAAAPKLASFLLVLAANPLTLIAAGVIALAGGLAYLAMRQGETIKAELEAEKAFQAAKDARAEYLRELQRQADAEEEAARIAENREKQLDGLNQTIRNYRLELGLTADAIDALPDESTTKVTIETDEQGLKSAQKAIDDAFPDGATRTTDIDVDIYGVDEALDSLDRIPADKKLEIEAKLEETRIQEQSKIIQASLEWTAKVDIAEVEAAAKRVEAIMGSVGSSVEGAASVLGSIFGSIGDMKDAGMWTGDIERMIAAQMEIQFRALEIQEKMAAAEIKMMEAKMKAMARGEALIQIDGAGLQPHLESFMFEILRAIQVRAHAEGQEFLLGV